MPALGTAAAAGRHRGEYVSRTRGIAVERGNVCVAPGGKPIMFWTIMALCEEGDEVIVPDPSFPIYESMTRVVGAKVVPLPILEERNFTFAPEDLAARLTPKTKLVILNSPANPTGGVLDKTDIEAIADILRDHDCYIMSDEIYSRMLYSGEHYSVAAEPGPAGPDDHPGRLLEDVRDDRLAAGVRHLPDRADPAHRPAGGQLGLLHERGDPDGRRGGADGPAGLRRADGGGVREAARLHRGRAERDPGDHLQEAARGVLRLPERQGAGPASKALADKILNEAGVAVLSGTAFGEYGEGYLRLSYANSIPNIEKALDRIGALAKTLA